MNIDDYFCDRVDSYKKVLTKPDPFLLEIFKRFYEKDEWELLLAHPNYHIRRFAKMALGE